MATGLLSRRGYAAERGVTEGAVRKAIKAGKIVPVAGLIDPGQADAGWFRSSMAAAGTVEAADPFLADIDIDETLRRLGAEAELDQPLLTDRDIDALLHERPPTARRAGSPKAGSPGWDTAAVTAFVDHVAGVTAAAVQGRDGAMIKLWTGFEEKLDVLVDAQARLLRAFGELTAILAKRG
jgi:hypothetical protein